MFWLIWLIGASIIAIPHIADMCYVREKSNQTFKEKLKVSLESGCLAIVCVIVGFVLFGFICVKLA